MRRNWAKDARTVILRTDVQFGQNRSERIGYEPAVNSALSDLIRPQNLVIPNNQTPGSLSWVLSVSRTTRHPYSCFTHSSSPRLCWWNMWLKNRPLLITQIAWVRVSFHDRSSSLSIHHHSLPYLCCITKHLIRYFLRVYPIFRLLCQISVD